MADGGVKKNSPIAVAGPSRTIHTSPTSSASTSQITSHVPANPPARPDFSLEGRLLPQGCTRKEPVDASRVPSNTCSSEVDVAMRDATGETLDLIDFDEPVESSSTAYAVNLFSLLCVSAPSHNGWLSVPVIEEDTGHHLLAHGTLRITVASMLRYDTVSV